MNTDSQAGGRCEEARGEAGEGRAGEKSDGKEGEDRRRKVKKRKKRENDRPRFVFGPIYRRREEAVRDPSLGRGLNIEQSWCSVIPTTVKAHTLTKLLRSNRSFLPGTFIYC